MALSERQFEILRALFNRERPEEIARRLGIGLPAVNWYRRGIFIHLGIHSKLELLPLMVNAGTFQMPTPFSGKTHNVASPRVAP